MALCLHIRTEEKRGLKKIKAIYGKVEAEPGPLVCRWKGSVEQAEGLLIVDTFLYWNPSLELNIKSNLQHIKNGRRHLSAKQTFKINEFQAQFA